MINTYLLFTFVAALFKCRRSIVRGRILAANFRIFIFRYLVQLFIFPEGGLKRGSILALLTTGHAAEHWFIGVLAVVLPSLRHELILNYTQVGLLISGRSGFSALSSAVTGLATDRFGGGKWVLVACLAGIALAYGGISLSPSFLILLPIFWVSGLITHLWHPPSMGLLGEKFRDRKGFALGLHGTGANIGQAISPFVAGFLLLTLSWRSVLAVNMTPLLTMSLILWIWLPPFSPPESEKKKPSGDWLRNIRRSFLQNPVFGVTALISAAMAVSHHGLIAFLPLLIGSKYQMDPTWTALCIGVYSAASIIPETAMGFISDRVPRKLVLIVGAIVGGTAMLIIPAMAHGAFILIPVVLVAVFLRSVRPVIFAYALEVSPTQLGGSTVGLMFTTNQTFSMLGPLAAGVFSDLYGIEAAFWFYGTISLLTLPLFALIPYSPMHYRTHPVEGDQESPSFTP